MSSKVALLTQSQALRSRDRQAGLAEGLRSFAVRMLLATLTICLATFLVGGPVAHLQANDATEVGQQDAASVGDSAPSIWLRRAASGKDQYSGVGPEMGPLPEHDLVVLEAVGELTSLHQFESLVSFTNQRRPAAPVRGPPCA